MRALRPFSLVRPLLLGLSVALAAGPALAGTAGIAVSTRGTVVVADETVRLGDLFRNLPANADRPVAPAPQPGERTVYDTPDLTALATANGIDWQPRGRGDRVTVERGSRVVDGPQVQRQLARVLADGAAGGNGGREMDVEIEGRLPPIHLPIGAHRIRFEDVSVDDRAERVTATVVAPTGDGRESRTSIAARLYPLTDVPVVTRPLMPGEPIRDEDVEWVKQRAGKLRQGTATELRHLVGRTPRRPVSPGAPLALRDLQDRVVVSKGSLVTIVLQTPNMTLTTRGKALDDGASGVAIRVLNAGSDRTVEATVIGPDVVEIKPAQSIAALLGRKM